MMMTKHTKRMIIEITVICCAVILLFVGVSILETAVMLQWKAVAYGISGVMMGAHLANVIRAWRRRKRLLEYDAHDDIGLKPWEPRFHETRQEWCARLNAQRIVIPTGEHCPRCGLSVAELPEWKIC